MDNNYVHGLYTELVSRIEHVDRAFIARRHIKLHYAKTMPNESTKEYIKVRQEYTEFFNANEEALLWFISIEIWSRFIANSKRGLRSLIYKIDDDSLKKSYSTYKKTNKVVMEFIDTQRSQYFAHADDVSWTSFPNVWDKEYEKIINETKLLLRTIGKKIKNQRIPTLSQKHVEEHTDKLFDALLLHLSSEKNVRIASEKFKSGLEIFKKS